MSSYTEPHLERSALVSVHMQEDVVRPGAAWELEGAIDILPASERLAAAFRRHGRPVIHTVRLYPEDGSDVDLCRREAVEAGWHVVLPHTPGSQVAVEMRPRPDYALDPELLLSGQAQRWGEHDWVVYTPRFGGFHRSALAEVLEELGCDTVCVIGQNFPNCPRTTIFGALDHDLRTVAMSDCLANGYEAGFDGLRAVGVTVVASDELIEALSAAASGAPA